MSFWSIMNWVAWGLSIWIAVQIIRDVIRVEKERR